MKLVLAVVSSQDTNAVINHLLKAKFYVTKLATSGGFLKVGNTTLLVGVDDEKVGEVIKIIETHSKRRKEPVPLMTASEFAIFSSQVVEVPVGGATVFVLSVEQFKKL